jgi:hypothetical protein
MAGESLIFEINISKRKEYQILYSVQSTLLQAVWAGSASRPRSPAPARARAFRMGQQAENSVHKTDATHTQLLSIPRVFPLPSVTSLSQPRPAASVQLAANHRVLALIVHSEAPVGPCPRAPRLH